MKLYTRRLAAAASFVLVLLGGTIAAQNVNVTGAIVGNGTYPDLGSAFTAINSGAQTGAIITVSVVANTTETTTATLNAGAWTQLNVVPVGGAGRIITGNIAGPLIDFNGADKILVDGLNSGGNSLTLSNTDVTGNTIRFINDAHVIAVQNATLLGAGPATVLLSTGTLTGNDTVTINSCLLDGNISGNPTVAIASSGTAGMDNSAIVITNNNIANTFNPLVVTAAIYAQSNSSDWIISNNRIYQTASRTYTTANTHRGIWLASGNNHSVTGNVVGYASSSQTGVYTMSSTVATRFVGIELSVGNAVPSSVQGNTVASISLSTSSGATTTYGVLCGIYILGSSSVNVGTITPNTIGSTTGTGSLIATPTTSQGTLMGISSIATGTIVIQNNLIGALTSSGSTAAVAGGVIGINCGGVAASMTITGNTIGNATADNIRGGTSGLTTGSSIVSGIYMSSTPTVSTITNNTIRNLSSYGSGTSGYVRGFWTATTTSGSSTMTISGNTITALTTNSGLTGITSGLVSACGIHMLSAVGVNIDNNTINDISNTSTATTNIYVVGISVAASSVTTTQSTTVFNNRIYNLRNSGTGTTSTAPPTVAGINIRSGNAATTIYNNMISLGSGQTTNTAFVGILGNHGSTPNPSVVNIYNNSINIEGAVASGALSTFCINRGDLSATARTISYDIRNNILTNTRTGGTGFHFAISNNFGVASAQPTGWSSNYNVLNANASTVGYWNANMDFANWQSASASDAFSYSGISVVFVNSASDLHLNMGTTPTVLESGGTNIALYSTDIDAQNRPGPTGSVNGGALSYDLGADEFDGVFLDGLAPTITYNAFAFTCATNDRTLTATIADLSGVPTTGLLRPRIYFRKNANAWVSAPGTLMTGTATNGTWDFVISSAAMGGLVLGDVVSYYVIAQDISTPTPNIRSNPSAGLVASDVNTITTPPTTPNSYTISGTLSGTYTVGTTGVFPTLTSAVTAYNNSCLSGPVVFSLIDNTYPAETYPIVINANPLSSSVNTLTIKPATGATPVFSGSTTTAIITLNGADYVTIDGSNGSTVNSTCPRVTATRNMTIENTNTSTASAVVALTTTAAGDGATNNRIMNTLISGNGSLTTGVAVNLSGPTIGSGTGANGNNNNQIVNNKIIKAQVGIFSAGSSAVTKSLNNTYSLNSLDSTGTNGIGRIGVMLLFEDAPVVSYNRIANIVSTASVDVAGITLGSNALSNSVTTSAETTNGLVEGNVIDSIRQTNTFSAGGIFVAATATGTTTVRNNMINQVFANGTAGDFAVGIYYGGGAGLMNIYHNTVVVNGTALTGASQPNMAIGINGTTPTVDIRNNILVCAGNNGFNGNTGIGLAYSSTAGNYVNLTSDNNDIFVSGSGSAVGRTGGLATGVTRITLNDWQFETGRDAASVSVLPSFVSALNDIHLVVGSNPLLEDAGAVLPSITTDIDCDTRNACTPDIGADEFGTPREAAVKGNGIVIADGDVSPTTADFTLFDSTSVCNGTVTRSFYVVNPGGNTLSISGATVTGANASDFSITVTPAATVTAGDSTMITVVFDPSAAGVRNAVINIANNDCDEATYDFAVQGIGTQITIDSLSFADITCFGDSTGSATVFVIGGMPAITYSWSTGGTAATESALPAGTHTVIVSDANGCSDTLAVSIAQPSIIVTNLTVNDASCFNGTGSASVAPTGGLGSTFTYNWTSGGTGSTETGLIAGTYYVTVTDSAGCSVEDTAVVNQPTDLVTTVDMVMDVTTCGGNDGGIMISVSGGTAGYTYVWSNSATTEDVAGLTAGTYFVIVTDANGCLDSTAVLTVNDPAAPVVTYTEAADTICQSTTAPFALGVASPAGGTFSGPGVSANTFDPMQATIGWNVITYTYTDSLTNCFATAVDSIFVDVCTGISAANAVTEVNVYPNPTDGVINLNFGSDAGDVVVMITDAAGRMVYMSSENNVTAGAVKQIQIDEASGVYLLHVNGTQMNYTQRIVIRR
ncbi:MAG: T9SS type A sorting domain-containing protein [Bacteroidia bacterium]|nr:T9SS type A sorting domain-containing protein [Bacteroidia bacterium]